MNDAATALTAQLDKPPVESKKYGMTRIGVVTIFVVFLISAGVFLANPSAAAQIVLLAQMTVVSIAGLVGAFCGAQAAVDARNSSSLAAVVESNRKEKAE
jgi:quinol-cytochrome oxidoreductase complex cytochrome b subunit